MYNSGHPVFLSGSGLSSMISGINSSGSYPLQSGNAPLRERSDVARTPAASPDRSNTGVREDLANPLDTNKLGTNNPSDNGELLQRRVEARRAAEDVRLERFNADEVSLATSRALSTFAQVAAQQDDQDVELAGIDIRI